MSTTKSGSARYPKLPIRSRPRMIFDGRDLGIAMTPADVYIEIKRLFELDDDELLEAFAHGAEALPHIEVGPRSGLVLGIDDLEAAASAAKQISRSRLTAWRKGAREMTWQELRMLLLGLRYLVLGRVSIHAGDAATRRE